MKLQTIIPLERQSSNLIDYHSNILLLGSCFVENIGEKLDYFKFQNIQNPLGVLFQPKAIEVLIDRALKGRKYTEDNLFFHNEQWHCFDAHSKLSHSSKGVLLEQLNLILEETRKQIQQASHIIITLGTSWVYKHIKTDTIVANCHKVPQKLFEKRLLSVDDISESLKNILSLIRSVKYDTTVLFTVSPVRHIKDGFVENTQSKSHLITAIHRVVKNKSFYFPSYEIMMDELRDYRFYKEDMIHPNGTAIKYIWEKLKTVWITEAASKTMYEVDGIQKGLQHKSFNPESKEHKQFLKSIEKKKDKLRNKYNHISL